MTEVSVRQGHDLRGGVQQGAPRTLRLRVDVVTMRTEGSEEAVLGTLGHGTARGQRGEREAAAKTGPTGPVLSPSLGCWRLLEAARG